LFVCTQHSTQTTTPLSQYHTDTTITQQQHNTTQHVCRYHDVPQKLHQFSLVSLFVVMVRKKERKKERKGEREREWVGCDDGGHIE